MTKLLKYENKLNLSYNGGGDAYVLQSVAIHFNHTVGIISQII